MVSLKIPYPVIDLCCYYHLRVYRSWQGDKDKNIGPGNHDTIG